MSYSSKYSRTEKHIVDEIHRLQSIQFAAKQRLLSASKQIVLLKVELGGKYCSNGRGRKAVLAVRQQEVRASPRLASFSVREVRSVQVHSGSDVKYEVNLKMLKKTRGKKCPCVLVEHPDTMCPCVEFTDTGRCRCGLFKITEV